MPSLRVNGADIHYEERGAGAGSIVFAHGLLFNGHMFDHQVDAFADRYRCIAYDFRGQGQSEVTASGYDMDALTEDASALIAALGVAPCHFVGLSMGGFVGMRLAIRRPELLRSLILLETTAGPEPAASARRYRLMNFVARLFGFGIVTERVMRILFGAKFMSDPTRAVERNAWRARLLGNDRVGVYRAVEAVCARAGVEDDLPAIAVPTLIVVGDADVATPPERAHRMHAGIAGSRLVVISGAGHSASIEEPQAVNAAIGSFLRDVEEARR